MVPVCTGGTVHDNRRIRANMSKPNQLIQAVTRSPFLWGILGTAGFYALVLPQNGPLHLEKVQRYFAHHPVEYMLTVMFAVGLAALIIKVFDVLGQRTGLRDSLLDSVPRSPQPLDECNAMLAKLERLPGRRQGEYYVRRLRTALQHMRQRGSADTLDDELKYLSDLDASRLHGSYGLFRAILWAIPILGFLGTVIGITMALNSIDLQSPDKSMPELLGGLGLKFDTTALALAMSMVLVFVHFSVEHAELGLLDQVDQRVQEELGGRFTTIAMPTGGDGHLVAARRMAEAMQQTTEVLMKRQAELWQASVDTAAKHWAQMAESSSRQVGTAMSNAVAELTRQAEVLGRAVTAAGEVTRLEDALNRNLAGLAGAKHFEQTVLSLAAAVNMLSAHLAETPNAGAPIRLDPSRRAAHAA